MGAYNKKNRIRQSVFPILMCILLGWIAITISSKNSFLYEFNDSGDVQVFVTTARCMLRGDVLYRDVFDVKGPFHYFFYICGLLIDNSSLLGIYLLESILFVGYVILTYRIASLYLNSPVMCLAAAALSAFVATVMYDMYAGGQCEELLLPFLALALYLVLKYFRYEYPKPMKWYQVMTLGVLAAIVFWTKYTLLGLFLGIILYVLYLQIINRRIKELWIYVGEFLGGFLLGSIPVIIYFAANNAFGDLWEVYFYDLLFAYKSVGDDTTHLLTNKFYLYYIGASALTAFALIFPLVDNGKHMKKQERAAIVLMIMMEAVGISCSRRWWYSAESMHVFAVLGVVGMVFALKDCRSRTKELFQSMASAVDRLLNCKIYKQWYFLPAGIALLLLIGKDIFLLPIVVLIGAVMLAGLLRICYCKICGDAGFHKGIFIGKYLLLAALYYGSTIMVQSSVAALLTEEGPYAVSYLFGIATLLTALEDYYFYEEMIRDKAARLYDQWKKEYQDNRVKINCLVGVLAVMMFGFYCYTFSKSTYDIGRELESKPQYKLAEYINNSGIENPVIINYKNIDSGVYWLTNTYPPARFSCGFNLNLPEIEEMYTEYIEGQKADFIVVENEDYHFEGYKAVYTGNDIYVNTMDSCTLILLEKICK